MVDEFPFPLALRYRRASGCTASDAGNPRARAAFCKYWRYLHSDESHVTMAEQSDRYYFIGARVTTANRYRSAFLVILSLAIIALTRTPSTLVFFGICALAGIYGLLRPARPGSYVELGDKELVVKALTKHGVRYEDLESAHFLQYKEHDLVEGIKGAANMLGRFFGGSAPKMRPGEIDENIVLVYYTRPRWVFFPLPPFVWYSKFLYLRVEGGSSLMTAINARIGKS